MLTITVSAQERTPVDKICEDIYSAVPGLPRLNDKMKSHQEDGIVTYSNRAYFDGIFYVKKSFRQRHQKQSEENDRYYQT